MNKKTKIKQIGNKALKQKANKIADPQSGKTKEIIRKMELVLSDMENGLALAAPQIGINKQIILVKKYQDENIKLPKLTLINPEIISKSKQASAADEGCLSVANPEIRGEVKRANKISIKYLDPEGKKKKLSATGFLARVLQHEIDHLHGKLFLDRADPTSLYQVNNQEDER